MKGESEAKVNHLLEKKDFYPFGTVSVITSSIQNILVSLYSYGPRFALNSFRNRRWSCTGQEVEG